MNSTRDAVAEAFDKVVAAGSQDPVQPDNAAAGAEDLGAAERNDQPTETASEKPTPSQSVSGGQVRDDQGRFTKPAAEPKSVEKAAPAEPKGEAKAAGDAITPAGAVSPAAAPAPLSPELKPPADWRPLAKEKWKTLPREVQEETLRLHTEAKKGIEESAPARQHLEEFRKVVGPHEGLIRANGSEPMRAIGSLLQREAALLQAPPQTRAQILAQGIRTYLGTDQGAIDLLAKAIDALGAGAPAGAAPTQQPTNVETMVEKALEQRLHAANFQRALSELQAFGTDPKHEFFDQVKGTMLKLLQAGLANNYPEAYEQACQRDTQIAAVRKQRGEAEAARKQQQQAPAQAAAAAGLKSEPAGPAGNGKAKSTREEVERQMDRLTRARV